MRHKFAVLVSTALVLPVASLLAAPGAARADTANTANTQLDWVAGSATLSSQGSTVLATAGRPAVTSLSSSGPHRSDSDPFFHGTRNGAQDHLASPASTRVQTSAAGFDGLNEFDQARADGGHQRQSGTPDQALCVGNGFVVQAVNNALRVFDTSGAPQTDPIALGPFFGDGDEVLSTSPVRLGALHSDPRCMYDAATGRFFVTDLRYHRDPNTFAVLAQTQAEIAVSASADPRGAWNIFTFDTTADGTKGSPALSGCPCFGDQPELGADANGVYLGVNEFTGNGDSNNLSGVRINALSKAGLENGTASTVTTLTVANTASKLMPFNAHPAIVPPGASFDSDNGGTELFVADCDNLTSQLIVIAVTNTQSLSGSSPNLGVSDRLISTETTSYAGPFAQREGARPLASWIQQQTGGSMPPLEYPDSGTACNQLEYADGRLWTARTTVVKTENGPLTDGVAWEELTASVVAGQVNATIQKEGYVAIDRNNVELPAIAVDRFGRGVISLSVYGQDYYPSAGYVPIDENGTGPLTIVGQGTEPLDSFTGYSYFGASSVVARYGDYGAAATAGDGQYWIAQEYEGNAPRTFLANWSTRIAQVG